MEREPQFFKPLEKPEEIPIKKPVEIPRERPEEAPEIKPEEVLTPEAEEILTPKPDEIVIPEAEIEKLEEELESKERIEKEKGEFFNKMQKDEEEMIGGILRKFVEAPARLKKRIMILTATVVILSILSLSAGKAFAGGEHWQRTHQGWQNIARQVERMPYQYGARENQKAEAIRHQYQLLKERARFDAYQDYQRQAEAIQRTYEQRKFDIMIGRVEGATDYFGKQKAYQELKEWKNKALKLAFDEWLRRVWIAQEEYYQKVQQIQQWR